MLPEIAAEVVPVPAVGDVPVLAFQRAENTGGTLSDYRGRYLVVHFWASWCGPCKQQLPALRRLHERFAPRGLAALGLSLDDDPDGMEGCARKPTISAGRKGGSLPSVTPGSRASPPTGCSIPTARSL